MPTIENENPETEEEEMDHYSPEADSSDVESDGSGESSDLGNCYNIPLCFFIKSTVPTIYVYIERLSHVMLSCTDFALLLISRRENM